MQSIQALKDKHKGQTAYITAKGPSIEFLQKEDIGDGIVIAMNESIRKIDKFGLDNKVYSIQVDLVSDPDCNASIILHNTKSAVSGGHLVKKSYYVIDPEKDFNHEANIMSSILSIELAKLMGCTKIVMVSFDSYTIGVNEFWLGNFTAVDDWTTQCYLGQALGLNNYLADNNITVHWFTPKPKHEGNTVKLIIATPFKDKIGYSSYILSMVKMVKLLGDIGVDFDFWPLDGDYNADKSRNRLLAKFMLSDATDILFIDSDKSWVFDSNQSFLNIIAAPYEIVAGVYPVHHSQEYYEVAVDVDEDGKPIMCPETKMLQATKCTSGFMRIKRSCIEKMQEAYPETQYLDNVDCGHMLVHNLFESAVHKHYRLNGDFNFCRKWEEIGGKVWIEPRITIGNFGVNGWFGSYHDFLLQQPGGSSAPKEEPVNQKCKGKGKGKGKGK